MRRPLRDKSRPLPGQDHTPLPPITGPYIRCNTCGIRAYLVPDWSPSWGINPFLRKFLCESHHDTYKAFTQADLNMLNTAGQKVKARSSRPGL